MKISLTATVIFGAALFLGALPRPAFSLNWTNGLNSMGGSLSDTGRLLMQQQLQEQQLEQQHQQQMQEMQEQHDLQMQQLQEQQRVFLEQQQRLEADRQRAEQERQQRLEADRRRAEQDRQKLRAAATAASKAIADAAEMAHLVKTFPDWRKIVGQVDISKQQPDPNNLFRKWLATKDAAYQATLNSTNSAIEIESAIALFRAESVPPS